MTLGVRIGNINLTGSQACTSFESIYCMGNPHELSDSECEVFSMAYAIIDNEDFEDKDTEHKELIMEWEKSGDPNDIKAAKSAKEALKEALDEEAKELAHTIKRHDGGYVKQIKMHLKFDLDLFDYSCIQNKREKIKILYLVYLLKKDHGKNVLEVFSKPSMENIDNSFLKWVTYNGAIIKKVKQHLERELAPGFVRNIKGAVTYITSSWDNYLQDIQLEADRLAVLESNEFKISTKLIPPENTPVIYNEYQHSPIETLYLKIVQHEALSQIKDILKTNEIQWKIVH